MCFGTIFFHILRLRNTAYYYSRGPTYPKRRQSFMKRLKDRQPTFLTTRARVKCQVSRSIWQCGLRYCEDGNRVYITIYVRFGMSRGCASPGMITRGWRGTIRAPEIRSRLNPIANCFLARRIIAKKQPRHTTTRRIFSELENSGQPRNPRNEYGKTTASSRSDVTQKFYVSSAMWAST